MTMKIYLAGGFRTGWQDEVIEGLPSHEFLDPREHKMHDPRAYTERDKEMIDECDLVFAYMESSNPGWPNMAFEIGYAHAKGKRIILINEKSRRFAEMPHVVSEEMPSLEEAIVSLSKEFPL
jgi:nucleoside 2-deoxyribosyltransferase